MADLSMILALGLILLVFVILLLAICKTTSKKGKCFAVAIGMMLVITGCNSISSDSTAAPVNIQASGDISITDVLLMDIRDSNFYEENPTGEADQNPEEFQDKIAAVLFFENATGTSRELSEGALVIDKMTPLEYPDLFCGASYSDDSIYLYIFNSGWGEAVDVNIAYNFFAKYSINENGKSVFKKEIPFDTISDSANSIQLPLVCEVSAKFVCEIPIDTQKIKNYIATHDGVIYLSADIDDGTNAPQSSYVAELRMDEFGNLYILEAYLIEEIPKLEQDRFIYVGQGISAYTLMGPQKFLRIFEERNHKCFIAPDKPCEMDFHFHFFCDTLIESEIFHARVDVDSYTMARQNAYASDMYQCGIDEFLGTEDDLDSYVSKIRSGEEPISSIEYLDIPDLKFADLSGMVFYFSSGVGGWSTSVEIFPDGTFRGNYGDSDMGDIGESYPEGTRYTCLFQGALSSLTKTGDFEYSMKCESITQEGTEGEEMITTDGFRYITSSPYGFNDADEIMLYLPGKQVRQLPNMFLSWVSMPRCLSLQDNDKLPFYGLYNVEGQQGFSY